MDSIVWVLAAASVLGPSAAEAQGWAKPIDWLIPCSTFIEATLGADHPICDDFHYEGGIKATLDAASLWLEGLGFASPALSAKVDLGHHTRSQDTGRREQPVNQYDPRCEERYCAWLVYGLGAHGRYSEVDSSLTIDPFRTTEDGGLEPGYDDGFAFAEVHELFHAVQYGYPNVGAARDADWVEWITEGSAEHVALAAGRLMGLSVGLGIRLRTYDQPLHAPPSEEPGDWAYGSWEFFDFLGDYLGSADGVQYLDSLLAILRPGQKNGLEAVEAVVLGQSGVGLSEAFPEFVRRRLVRPCYFSQLGEWGDRDCVDGRDNEHRFVLAFPDTVRRWEHTAAVLGANGYLVRMEIPRGKVGGLTIRVPPDRDEEYLHLIVDDQRYDEPGTLGRRNEYLAMLPAGRHEFLVRLVNAPRDLSGVDVSAGFDFGADDPAPLEFILTEEVGAYRVTGDIALPETVVEGAAVTAMNRGSPAACQLGLALHSADRYPGLSLRAILPAGLGQRRYRVGDTGPGLPREWQTEIASPGVFFAYLEVGPEHGFVNERLRSRWFGSTSGEVEVHHFDGVNLSMRFSLTLREAGIHQDPGPRTVTVQGSVARALGKSITSPGGYQVGTTQNLPAFYLCDLDDPDPTPPRR